MLSVYSTCKHVRYDVSEVPTVQSLCPGYGSDHQWCMKPSEGRQLPPVPELQNALRVDGKIM